ncbi:MAG: GntR family transcriptional regulator [Desulfobacterales bacterium]|jgi:DNA-binding GntR family transcriptional regulator|nr:GntR family transcriptional regulator [Desulfobacterales bacterium]
MIPVVSEKNIKNSSIDQKNRPVEEAYDAIKNMLYYKELAPGQRLVYGDLAKKLHMSLTPVIQALNKLESTELVYYEPHKGYFVGKITEKEVAEIYQTREALEVAIVPAIMKNIREKDLIYIKESIAEYEKTFTEVESRRLNMLKNMQYHLKIAEYSHQTVILKVLRNLLERLALKSGPNYLGDERIKNAIKEHRRIFKAFMTKDSNEAIAAIRAHNRSSLEHVIGGLNKTVPISF